ncbi:MAG TPA: zinc-binding dehydrogenase [Candidatus Dormibacteraeota bacterium]
MRAAVLAAPGRFEVVDTPDPSPTPGQLLVRTRRASICGSDLHVVYDGFQQHDFPAPPGYPGHEGVGVVVATGQPVLTAPVPFEAGCFAELQAVAEESVVPIPEGADPDRVLMAQQLGTVLFAARRFLDGVPTNTAVVIGAGSVGTFFVQVLRRAGFRDIIVSDRESHRLDVARELGATAVVRAPQETVAEANADLVIEAAGCDETRSEAIAAAAPGGRVGLFGFPETDGLAPFPFNLAFRKSLTIQTSVGTQAEPGLRSFREAVQAIANGDYEVDYLLAPTYPLERIQEAIEAARARQGVKVSISFGES